MPSDSSFADLMARLQSGDDDAANKVFHRFAKQLIVLAHKQLDPHLRQKVDAEDVTQSVFRSFFAHQAAGELVDLGSWDGLWGMLVVMTLRKCRRQKTFFYADCRDILREVTLAPLDNESRAGWDPSGREPTPVEAAVLAETIDELLKQFAGRPRKILTLFLEGRTATEISTEVGCTERTVFRTYERVKEWLRYRATE
jgi:RNA polymerase sigma-70 factor (ECF subfamily)